MFMQSTILSGRDEDKSIAEYRFIREFQRNDLHNINVGITVKKKMIESIIDKRPLYISIDCTSSFISYFTFSTVTDMAFATQKHQDINGH